MRKERKGGEDQGRAVVAERERHEIRKGRVRCSGRRVSSLLRAAMSPSLAASISTQGFHFTLSTTVHIPSPSKYDACSLHLLHVLDSHVYADQYELAQRPDYTISFWGTSDLERPVSAIAPDNSLLLLALHPARYLTAQSMNVTLDVPLHARYGRPASASGPPNFAIQLKQPIGFFSCPGSQDSEQGQAMQLPAATDMNLGVPDALRPYTSLPGWPSSPMSLITDTSANDSLKVIVPVGKLDDLAWVDVGTAVVMIAMFFYLLAASIRTARRLFTKSSAKTN